MNFESDGKTIERAVVSVKGGEGRKEQAGKIAVGCNSNIDHRSSGFPSPRQSAVEEFDSQ